MTNPFPKLGFLIFLLLAPLYAAYAINSPAIQISTHFDDIRDGGSWLIIIHDADSQAVYPYLFDLYEKDNNFTIFTSAINYRIVSIMQFDYLHRKIANYCHFPLGIISNESMDIRITGILSANPLTSQCHIYRFKNGF